MSVDGFAPAKVNLTLHVTGQRDDGYHLLDSLVVFADVGDRVAAVWAKEPSFEVTGPRAQTVPTGDDNLVARAAALMGDPPVRLVLEKILPVASGVGGGSSDAAAALRVLSELTERPVPEGAAALGADVPVCLAARPQRMRGIGEVLDDVPLIPPVAMVLVNPFVPLGTPAVFKALARRDHPPMPARLPAWQGPRDFALWLATQRNDLELAARTLAPSVGEVIGAIAITEGCLLARMSGSGATCFGLYDDPAQAKKAAAQLSAARGDWWVSAAGLWALPPQPQRTRATT